MEGLSAGHMSCLNPQMHPDNIIMVFPPPPKLITNVENLEESVKVNDQNHKLQIQIILLNKLANLLMEILLLG